MDSYVDRLNYQQISQHFNHDSVIAPPELDAYWKIARKRKSFFTNAGSNINNRISFSSATGLIMAACDDDVSIVESETGRVLSLLQGSGKQIEESRRVNERMDAVSLKKKKTARKHANESEDNSTFAGLSIPMSMQAKIGMDVFTAFDVRPRDGKEIITVSRNMLVRSWDISDPVKPVCKKTWAGLHNAPVVVVSYHPSGEYFATGSTDGVVKVWSASGGFITHNLSGHSAVITAITFKSDPMKIQLVVGDNGGTISYWELKMKSETVSSFMKNHMTTVTSLAFSLSGQQLISASRDRVVNIWSLATFSVLHTLPLLESVESICTLPQTFLGSIEGVNPLTSCVFCTAGSGGIIRVWKFEEKAKKGSPSCVCVYQQEPRDGASAESYIQLVLNERKRELISVSTESVFSFLTFPTLSIRRQIVGYDDDMLDICYLDPDSPSSKVLLATNSPILRVMDPETFSCQLLTGHTDSILSVSSFPKNGYRRIHIDSNDAYETNDDDEMFVSSSKDQTARVWIQFRNDKDAIRHRCIFVCSGHTEEITSVSCSRGTSGPFGSLYFVTGSSDRTMKIWTLPDKVLRAKWKEAKVPSDESREQSSDDMVMRSHLTEIAHTKGITSICISPNDDSTIASCSLDKTAKIWEVTAKRVMLKAVLKGHSRAVSSVAFSSKEAKTLATGSSDKTVRIWSLSDFSCVRTLEGHGSAVMCVRFAPSFQSSSTQHVSKNQDQNTIISGSSDGTMKVWSIKSSQCIQTLASSNDNLETYFSMESGHDDKVWSFVISPDAKSMISVGSNSTMCVWKDCAEEIAKDLFIANRERLLLEEQLTKSFRSGDMATAFVLALSLDKALTIRQVLESVRNKAAIQSKAADDEVVKFVLESVNGKKLQDTTRDLGRLVGYAREWNTTTRNCHISQLVIRAVLKLHHQEENKESLVLSNKSELDELVTSLIPYTERHLRRVDKLMRDSYLLDHALNCAEELSMDESD